MSRDETMFLQDIARSCDKILRFTKNLTQHDLVQDEKTYDAVIRNLEIIGEASKNISDKLRTQLPEIDWRKAAGLRDMLAHAYFGIDDDILWDVIQTKIPQLASVVNNYLKRQ